jgi:hypothetical protein
MSQGIYQCEGGSKRRFADLLLGLLFEPEDGGDMLLRNTF